MEDCFETTISLLIVTTLTVQAATAPVVRTYTLFVDAKTWSEASRTCREQGTVLGTVYNKSTLPDLGYHTVSSDFPDFKVKEFWIGYRETEVEQKPDPIWKWESGFQSDWQGWNITQYREVELKEKDVLHCAAVRGGDDAKYTWFQENCETRLPYVCEITQNDGESCEFIKVGGRNLPKEIEDYKRVWDVNDQTFDACLSLCKAESTCASFEHSTDKRCRYSQTNVWEYIGVQLFNNEVKTYVHRRCNFGIIHGFGPTFPFKESTPSSTRSPFDVGRTFTYYTQTLSWSDAQSFCQSKGDRLAAVYDYSVLPDMGFYRYSLPWNASFWIGYHIAENATSWSWDGGTISDWTNWAKPPPFEDNKKCAVSLNNAVKEGYKWIPAQCSEKHTFICESNLGTCQFYLVPRSKPSNLIQPKETFDNINISMCEIRCRAAREFECYSFGYDETFRTCELSDVNTWTPNFERLTNEDRWTYGHRTCNTGYKNTQRTYPFNTLVTTVPPTTTEELTTEMTTFTSTEATTTAEITTVTKMETSTPTELTTEETTIEPTTEMPTTTKVVCQTIYIPTTKAPEPTTERPRRNTTEEPEGVRELKDMAAGFKAANRKKKKISVENKEPSARYVGYMSVVFIVVAVGIVLVADLATLPRDIAMIRRRLGFGKKKKVKKPKTIMTNPDKPDSNGFVPENIDMELESGVGNSLGSHEIEVEILPDKYFEEQVLDKHTEINGGFVGDGDNFNSTDTYQYTQLHISEELFDKTADCKL